ncbi:MAG: hypothetical protein IPM06_01095 [Rhizobiales bacterium]|nr:hypothetical protein [Hyphomicrobiales bacterium]
MKYVLAALCGIVVLFMGGCAIVSVAAMPLPIIPGGIAFLNILILGALFGWKTQWRPAFYILGVVDILLAIGAFVGGASAGPDASFFLTAGAVIGLKGLLSLLYARRVGEAAS